MGLAEVRKTNGLSQSRLASLVGVSQSSVASYESGTRKPSPTVAKRIAFALRLTTDQMWEMFYEEANGQSINK